MTNHAPPSTAQSLWRSFRQPGRRCELEEHVEGEYAIVGGGVEGLSLAGHLARSGRSVTVVEADEIASGATGASAGVVAPQLVRNTPKTVLDKLGRDQGLAFLKLLAQAGTYTFSLIGDRAVACGAVQGGFLAPAIGAKGEALINATVRQWQEIRPDLAQLDAASTAALSGAIGYSAALLDPSGGSLNPVAYADLLAGDAEEAGARIFVRSRVTDVKQTNGGWRISTRRGRISARTVVLCANGGSRELDLRLRRTILPLTVCQVATQILDPAVRRSILPNNHSLTDLEADVFSIRFDPEGRLVTAHPWPDGPRHRAQLEEAVNRRLAQALPGYRPVPLEFAWTGTAWLTSSLLPRLLDLGNELYALQACNGRGLALSGVIGRELARWFTKGGDCALPVQQPKPIPGYLIARHAPGIALRLGLLKQKFRRASGSQRAGV